MWKRLRAANVCRLGGCVFQSWIRRTAAGRCLFPAAHRTRPSSTAPSAHPTASAHPQQPQRPSHPAPFWGPPQTTAQRRKTPLPLTPSLQEADQASDWSLWFLAAMLKWGGREMRDPWSTPVSSPLCFHLSSFQSSAFLQRVVSTVVGEGTWEVMQELYWLFYGFSICGGVFIEDREGTVHDIPNVSGFIPRGNRLDRELSEA